MDTVIRFVVTFATMWFAVVLLLSLYEGSTDDAYRNLERNTTRILVFAAAVAFVLAVVTMPFPLPMFSK